MLRPCDFGQPDRAGEMAKDRKWLVVFVLEQQIQMNKKEAQANLHAPSLL